MLFETYSGRMVDLMDLSVEDMYLDDMLVPLSRIGRYGNHTRNLYSVGLHTIFCVELARMNGESDDVIRYLLGHDLSESYLGDIPRPLKRNLSMYGEVEEDVQNKIWTFLGLAVPDDTMMERIVKYDNGILYWESYMVKRNVGDWGRAFYDDDLIPYADTVESWFSVGETTDDVYDRLVELFRVYF